MAITTILIILEKSDPFSWIQQTVILMVIRNRWFTLCEFYMTCF